MPAWQADRKISQKYNSQFEDSFNNIVDFIQLHYFTKRSDSKFWQELNSIMIKTDFNQEHIEVWKKSLPQKIFFNNPYCMFPAEEFTSIMAGLGMFDKEYIAKQLTKTYSPSTIENNLKIYNDFLKFSKNQKYIKHELLLKRNNILT